MTDHKEIADRRYTRPLKQTAEDRRIYSGVAQVPLARQWMLSRYDQAREARDAATSKTARARFDAEMKRWHAKMKRGGMLREKRA